MSVVTGRMTRSTILIASFLYSLLSAPSTDAVQVGGTLPGSTPWIPGESPYTVIEDILIPEDGNLVIDPGVRVLFCDDTQMIVRGRIDALGTPSRPVRLQPERVEGRWKAVILEQSTRGGVFRHLEVDGGSSAGSYRTGMISIHACPASVLIEDCTFSNWPEGLGHKAIDAYASPDVTVRRCEFLEGPNEAVFGIYSPIVIENCVFHHRRGYSDAIDLSMNTSPDPVPVLRNNIFLGSDDDGIDLDTCDAIVDSNLVMNCRGGSHDPIGISGDKESQPTIINNVIINCENGIGFKNGSDIFVANNTIIDCDRGIWLHQDATHASVINTIIWSRPGNQSIVLESGSTIDVRYSLISNDEHYPGEETLTGNPLFKNADNGNYRLLPESPCIDRGTIENAPRHDFDGTERPQGEEIDIGAFEFIPGSSNILRWIFHK